jgi:hypothetical protein
MAQVLVSDGQQALVSGLQWLAYDKQRCHWHAARDLYGAMHEDGADLSQKYLAKKELAGIIRIRLPKEDFEQVRDQDKAALENSMREAQCKLSDFAGKLFRKGYYRAANYVRRTQDNLFTYVRSWLASGLVCPRASSMIERMMREIGRRLKRIAFGWSEQGAAQMTRIIIKRITSPQEWEAFWNKRLNISGNVILAYRGIRLLPQTLGR